MIITCSNPGPPMSQAQGVESGGLVTSGHAEPSGAQVPITQSCCSAFHRLGFDPCT